MSGLLVAERIEVHGIVQGVGFRPFVHRLATELGLQGHVGNDSAKVFIEVAGLFADVERFADRLTAESPPLARVDRLVRRPRPEPVPTTPGFSIVDSVDTGDRVDGLDGNGDDPGGTGMRALLSPDTAICEDCRRELFDPQDRRFGHPFITCTNCGPRFTIITDVPYDRPNTTMAHFPMCDRCRAEYEDPTDRRHHAQPIACHDCGPSLSFRPGPGLRSGTSQPQDPISAAAAAIAGGAVVAIKGLGGYHLACDATDEQAVARLRQRKQRPDKPFAVMVADVEQAADLATVSPAEFELLTDGAAPVVLLEAATDTPVCKLVAPGNPMIGLMLAYTPLHQLLLTRCRRPLVMTSANRGGQPIAWTSEKLDELADLIDAVLDHDRSIHQPCDDSVVRVVGNRLLPIRRARGYAPIPVTFANAKRSVLAVGAELKNTFCLASGDHAWVSQHLGDMANLETLEAFESGVERYSAMYSVAPTAVAADAHPGYLTSGWARRRAGRSVVEVQHHHAHVAAVMAEHHLDPERPVIGFAFDGTGYGADGTIWGGEVLVANADRYERLAHLAPIPLPGGDAAIEQPARVALAHLKAAGVAWDDNLAPVQHFDRQQLTLLDRQIERSINCVPTTSMGRLFDAVAALVGLRQSISYEAQAAIELEIAAARNADSADRGYRFSRTGRSLDPGPVLTAILTDLAAGVDRGVIAWRFHRATADMVADVAADLRRRRGIEQVALTGGVFQNALLTELCLDALESIGLRALTHSLVPPNDGGLALGQAYVAAHQPIQGDLTCV